MPQRKIIISLKAKDEQAVRRALQGLGKDGEVALKRIERESAKTQRSFRGLKRRTNNVKTAMASLGQGAGGVVAGLRAMGPAGVAAAAGIAGFGAALVKARRAITELDVLDDTASKLGLGVEALQELRFAAEQTGVTMRTFDLAMQRFTRRMAEAAVGTGEAKAAFAEMGIELRDSSGNLRSSEAVLNDVADALAATEDPSTRLRLAFKLFDSEGAAVVNTLKGGSQALDAFREEAREAGAVMDASLVQRASETADELARLERVINTQVSQAVVDLGPILEGMAEGFAAASRAVADLIDNFRRLENRTTRGLKSRFEEIQSELAALDERGTPRAGAARITALKRRAELERELSVIEARFEASGFAAAARASPVTPPVAPPPSSDPFAFIKPPSLTATEAYNSLGPPSGRAPRRTRDRQESGTPVGSAFGSFRAAQEAQFDVGEDLAGKVEEANQLLDRLREAALTANGEIIQAIELRRDREIDALSETALSSEQQAEARVLIEQRTNAEILQERERLAESQRRLSQETQQIFNAIGLTASQVFTDMVVDGEFTAESILKSFQRVLVSNAFQQILGAIGFGPSGGLLSGLFTGGAGAATAATTAHTGGVPGVDAMSSRTMPAALFTTAPRLHGGLAPNEFPAVLQRGEGVFTRGQMAAMGGRGLEVTVNNYGPREAVKTSQTESGLQIDIDAMIAGALSRQGSKSQKAIESRISRSRRAR